MNWRARGQALAEITIVLPVFLLIVLATVDFGRAIYYYAVLANGAREGARYAIVHGSLSQTLDGSCGSGPGGSSVSTDAVGSLVILATGAVSPGWAPPPASCATPVSVPAVGLDPGVYKATACWGDECTVPSDCSAAGTNTSPSNAPNVPVTVRTCYRFSAILPSLFGVGPIALSADSTLFITH